MRRSFILLSFAAMALPAMAVDSLSSHTNSSHYFISRTAESSGVTYNRDTNTLFVVGDEGQGIEQYSLTGQFIDSMTLEYNVSPRENRAVDDAEGIAYLGNGQFMIADERDNVGRVTTYQAGATRTLADLTPTSYAFGPAQGNEGLEGVAYDPINGSIWGLKEQNLLSIYNMASLGAPVTEPISRRNITRLNLITVSDIFVMANSNAFALDDPRRLNLLLLSRGSNQIVEITRDGTLVDHLDLSFLTAQGIDGTEGITMDDLGNIYLVSEVGGLNVLTSAVPEPSTYALIGIASLGALLGYVRKRKLAQ
jgi:uncharacterized protein YjiK